MRILCRFLPMVCLVALALAPACGGGGGTSGDTPAAPIIASFTASPTAIAPGASSTLSWSVSDADSLSIDQGVGSVTGTSMTVAPTTTTTYTLMATNAAGSTLAKAVVTVKTASDSGTWTPTGSLVTPRCWYATALLQSSDVLMTGGVDSSLKPIASAEVYNHAAASWTATQNMATARDWHSATTLASGKVLAVGGLDSTSLNLSSGEIYDPAAGTWTPAGSMATGRSSHTATLLLNGLVLVAGGSVGPLSTITASAELYNPATNTWTATGSLGAARFAHSATLLKSGKVLVAGGIGSSGSYLASAEVYDPGTGAWSSAASMNTGRAWLTATLLPDGTQVLVVGGQTDSTGAVTASAEIFDAQANTWTVTGGLATARALHTATLLANGKVLAAGGATNAVSGSVTGTCELFDDATGRWTATGTMKTAVRQHTAHLLADGTVLVAGGNPGPITNAEIYNP